ncbi:MAG TPA: nuclear transport factor 2 family protein [Egibacteraceae bacterium]|nr:nuclear transport factor 2 family protein [Egibacteraceae bacterium]HVM14590.1 nuclear transport factor 2 family protein [Egibacteraceae bacterium]HVM19037.1 nuclear transport factor 2 family protein [Egibacteraceae bacterium]
MGEARAVMDRLTEALVAHDMGALAEIYAVDAVVESPDVGEIKGRDQIIEYFVTYNTAFPDARYEPVHSYEAGNAAIDEGYFVGTHTGPLELADGETIPPTGRTTRYRVCDVAETNNGMVYSHRLYFDQYHVMEQLGLLSADS